MILDTTLLYQLNNILNIIIHNSFIIKLYDVQKGIQQFY